MNGNKSESDIYVYLDFTEKLSTNIFENIFFLRISNLHKSNPLIQINDSIYKGVYDESIGTNMFFEEIEDPPIRNNVYEKETPIRLKYIMSQTKMIKLKQVKLPKKVSVRDPEESPNLNLKQDYKISLNKLEQGTLNVEDLIESSAVIEKFSTNDELIDFEAISDETLEANGENECRLDLSTDANLLVEKYERLKKLSKKPVRRSKSPCKFKSSLVDHDLTNEIFYDVSFHSDDLKIERNFDNDRCILHGLLPSTHNFEENLALEDRKKIFNVDNFENLSLPARLAVLRSCKNELEEFIKNASKTQLEEMDENGKTVIEALDMLRAIISNLEMRSN